MNDNFDRDVVKNLPKDARDDLNADPITGEPGAHPVGTGVGAVGGATAGAAVGAIGGPVGALVGGAVGAVVGGLAGKGAAEAVNPTEEEAYSDLDYERDYENAYRIGYENRSHYDASTRFEDVESDLKIKWDHEKGLSRLTWSEARIAVKEAWDRATR